MTQSAVVPLFTIQTKTQPQIRDDILRTLANHMRGVLQIPNPNVGPGSDYYGIATGVANEICVGLSNGVLNANNMMPDTAGGSFLDRWLALFGLARTGATQSSGVVTPTYSLVQGYTLVPTGAVLLDSIGLRYQVTTGGQYGPGNPGVGQPAALQIPVQSIDTGGATDHQNGDQLTWVTLVPYIGLTVVGTPGGTDGLSGGNDSEATPNDEPPRQRLIATLQNPPAAGNWADVVRWIKQSSPDVQAGFCYPCLIGPATVFFVAIGAAQLSAPLTSTSKQRNLLAALMTGTVIPFVQGNYPERAAVVGSSAANQPADVALLLSLPAAPTASPSGPGGGWIDGTPWPASVGGTAPCIVTGFTSSTQFSVNTVPPPTAGVSHIAYLSPSNWQLYTAQVLAAVGSAGAWIITIDTPWPNLAADFAASIATGGPYIFPQSVNQANYVAAMLQGFANLGPGEWTANPSAIVRGFRHPNPAQAWPYSFDATFLRTVENAGTEVLAAAYLYKSATTPTVPAPPIAITVTEPFFLTSAPPNIFVPRNLAMYAQ